MSGNRKDLSWRFCCFFPFQKTHVSNTAQTPFAKRFFAQSQCAEWLEELTFDSLAIKMFVPYNKGFLDLIGINVWICETWGSVPLFPCCLYTRWVMWCYKSHCRFSPTNMKNHNSKRCKSNIHGPMAFRKLSATQHGTSPERHLDPEVDWFACWICCTEKKQPCYFPLYLLVYRDLCIPCNSLLKSLYMIYQ